MKINVKLDKEQVKEIGKAGLKIGKAIIVEGTKAVAVKGATAAIVAGFEKERGIKDLTLDEFLGEDKKKKKKSKGLGLFKKKKGDEDSEIVEEVIDAEIVEHVKIVEDEDTKVTIEKKTEEA